MEECTLKIHFDLKDPEEVVKLIQDQLAHHEMKKNIAFDLDDDELIVTISKLGTSKLIFREEPSTKGLTFVLASQKVALAHRAFKEEVKESIKEFVIEAGGSIDE